jgi:hypothetical protein
MSVEEGFNGHWMKGWKKGVHVVPDMGTLKESVPEVSNSGAGMACRDMFVQVT